MTDLPDNGNDPLQERKRWPHPKILLVIGVVLAVLGTLGAVSDRSGESSEVGLGRTLGMSLGQVCLALAVIGVVIVVGMSLVLYRNRKSR